MPKTKLQKRIEAVERAISFHTGLYHNGYGIISRSCRNGILNTPDKIPEPEKSRLTEEFQLIPLKFK